MKSFKYGKLPEIKLIWSLNFAQLRENILVSKVNWSEVKIFK